MTHDEIAAWNDAAAFLVAETDKVPEADRAGMRYAIAALYARIHRAEVEALVRRTKVE